MAVSVDIDIIVDLSLNHPDFNYVTCHGTLLQTIGVEPITPSSTVPSASAYKWRNGIRTHIFKGKTSDVLSVKLFSD